MIIEIKELLDAYSEKENAFSRCDYDRGYFCHSEINRCEDAESNLEKAIVNLIDSRLNELGLLNEVVEE